MAVRLKDRIEANIRQSDKVNSSFKLYLSKDDAVYTTSAYDGSEDISVIVSPNTLNVVKRSGDTMTGNLTVDSAAIYIKASLYPNFVLLPQTTNSAGTYSQATFEGSYLDQVSMWIYGDKTTSAKSRRGLVLYGYVNEEDEKYSLALRQCDNDGNWLQNRYILHTGNHTTLLANEQIKGVLGISANIQYYTQLNYYRLPNNVTSYTYNSVTYTPAANGNAMTGFVAIATPYAGVAADGTVHTSNSWFEIRLYSMNSSTGAILNYYDRYYTPEVAANKTSSSSYYLVSSANYTAGGTNRPVYLSNGRLAVGNYYVPSTGGTFTGQVAASSFKVSSNARYYTAMYSVRKAQTVADATYTSGTKTYTPVAAFAEATVGYFGMLSPYAFTYVDSSDSSTGTSKSGAYPMARVYSMNSSTGAMLSYYWTFRTAAVDNDLTANYTMYVPVSSSSARGGTSTCMYMSGGKLLTGNSFVPTTGGTFTGDITIQKTTTIANNYPAQLVFKVVQSDNSLTNTASWIKVYDDHDTATNRCNMVIQSGGNMILGSGESANNCYTNLLKDSTTEHMYITSDGNIYFYSNCGTWANHTTSVYISTAGVLYGACWNDYAEFRKTVYSKPGRVVVEKGDGSLCQSWDRLLPGCEIVSDTYGFVIGETEECKTPIAVSGRVLAYPYEDRESYQPGDAVCSAPGGCVSRMTRQEITMYPERIIGTVSEIPEYDTWGEKDIEVDGRIWIRIR